MNDSNHPHGDHATSAAAIDVRSIRPPEVLRLRSTVPALPHLRRPSFATEQYRSAGIQIVEHAEQLQTRGAAVLLVTSFEVGAGKTLTALNLALSLANDTERRVLLLEGDVYRSRLKTYFESTPDARSGLLQALQRTRRLGDVIRRVEDTRLDVLLAGGPHGESDVLTAPALAQLFQGLQTRYGMVLVDAPPLPALASARALLACASAVVVVARANRTRREQLEKVFEMVGQKRLLGVVLNRTRAPGGSYYEYA